MIEQNNSFEAPDTQEPPVPREETQMNGEKVEMPDVPYEEHERECLRLIDERDAAQEAISQAYFLVTGRSPEWSNRWDYKDCLEEIDDAQKVLRKSVPREETVCQEAKMCANCGHHRYDHDLDGHGWSCDDGHCECRQFEPSHPREEGQP